MLLYLVNGGVVFRNVAVRTVAFRNVAVRTVAFRNAALQLLWRPLFFCLQYCGLYFEVYNK